MTAAMELVAENGFHGAPMAMVAERAGVSVGTIYRYFETKDDLIVETYADLERRIYSCMLEKFPDKRPIRDKFLHIAKTLLLYCISRPMDYKFLEQFHHSPYGTAHKRERVFGKKCDSIVWKLFQEAMVEGIVEDLPLVVLLELAFSPVLAMARDHILGFVELDEEMIGRAVEGCWRAIAR